MRLAHIARRGLGPATLLLSFVLAAAPGAALAQDAPQWPQFLGPHRNGLSAERGLADRWPAGGPKVVWRKPGGVGMSGLAISGGLAATLVQADGQQWALALDARTGESKWKTAVAPAYRNSMGDGPRATPTIAGERVFVFTGEGVLAALQFADGKLLWSHNVPSELKGAPADYGMASSPLVAGDLVIVTAGAPNAAVVAYDGASGKLAWTAGQEPAGYSSPALLDLPGGPQVVAFTGGAALGLAPRTGETLWRHPYVTGYDCNIAVPLAIGGQVLLSAGENHGSTLLAPKPAGGKWELTEIWASLGPASVLRSEWQTPLLIDGHLYGLDNVGSAGPVTHLTCVEAATGKRVWQQTRFGKGNLIAADGKLFISTMKGELVLVRATPLKYEELARAEVIGSTRQAPSLAGGLLYLRDDREIVCLDMRP